MIDRLAAAELVVGTFEADDEEAGGEHIDRLTTPTDGSVVSAHTQRQSMAYRPASASTRWRRITWDDDGVARERAGESVLSLTMKNRQNESKYGDRIHEV